MHTNRLLILIGGLLLLVGARLPWMSVPILFGVRGPAYEAIEIGWEDNGIITGAIAVVFLLGGILVKRRSSVYFSLSAVLLAALAAWVVIGCVLRILEIHPSAGFFAAMDVGLYITSIGSLLALVGAWLYLVGDLRRIQASREVLPL